MLARSSWSRSTTARTRSTSASSIAAPRTFSTARTRTRLPATHSPRRGARTSIRRFRRSPRSRSRWSRSRLRRSWSCPPRSLSCWRFPFVLGVRDWRCYGLSSCGRRCSRRSRRATHLLFALAAASPGASATTGSLHLRAVRLTLAAKFVLWPVVVWLAATRRLGSAVLACAIEPARCSSRGLPSASPASPVLRSLRRLEDTASARRLVHDIVAIDLGLPLPRRARCRSSSASSFSQRSSS